LNILINFKKKIRIFVYAFNFNVQNYNVIAIENVFLLSVFKNSLDRIYKK